MNTDNSRNPLRKLIFRDILAKTRSQKFQGLNIFMLFRQDMMLLITKVLVTHNSYSK
jgi:hypothetical protein